MQRTFLWHCPIRESDIFLYVVFPTYMLYDIRNFDENALSVYNIHIQVNYEDTIKCLRSWLRVQHIFFIIQIDMNVGGHLIRKLKFL